MLVWNAHKGNGSFNHWRYRSRLSSPNDVSLSLWEKTCRMTTSAVMIIAGRLNRLCFGDNSSAGQAQTMRLHCRLPASDK